MKERTIIKGKIRSTNEIKEILSRAKPAENLKRGDFITGQVYNLTEDGVFIVTPENYIGFFHASEVTQPLKKGDKVEGRVTFIREDGRLNLSMRPAKEVGRVTDAEKILEYLKGRGGEMPYSDESPPETIKAKFGLSKNAFKRAMGKLIKDGLVIQDRGWTYQKKQQQDKSVD